MSCDPMIIWRPVPDQSSFKPKAGGDQNAFNVVITSTKNGGPGPTLMHEQIVAGTAAVPISTGDNVVFDVTLNIFHKPAAAVTLDLRVVDAGGNVVKVKTLAGATLDAQCDSSFSDGPAVVMIKAAVMAS